VFVSQSTVTLSTGLLKFNCDAIDTTTNTTAWQGLKVLIKVEVKKKYLSNGWSFSCFAAHLIKQDLF
jgi:hypothetical protein